MAGKGSARRRENTALVESNWDKVFGDKAMPQSNDPIADRMNEAELAEWERLKREGYALLAQANQMYRDAAQRK